MWASARYRVGQVFLSLRSAATPPAIAELRELLSEAELACFVAMTPRDRHHSLDVMRRVRERSSAGGAPASRDLLAAALLHDVGKGRLMLRDRVAFVLLYAVSERLGDALGTERGPRWRRALWRIRHHARLGAAQLTEAGSSARVVELVARHIVAKREGTGGDRELALLIAADDAS